MLTPTNRFPIKFDGMRHTSRRILRALRGRDFWQREQMQCEKFSAGCEHACWCIAPDLLKPDSVIYSFGVGEEISFDLELIRRFGVTVHAFDPTPRSVQWLARQQLPQDFIFHDYGVAAIDGTCSFHPPQ